MLTQCCRALRAAGLSILIVAACAEGPVGPGDDSLSPVTVPVITSVQPGVVPERGPRRKLTVRGENFGTDSRVVFQGVSHRPVFVSAGQLEVEIPADEIAAAGSYSVVVENPIDRGGASAPVYMYVGTPSPLLDSISPRSIYMLDRETTLHIYGHLFVQGAVLFYNGRFMPATFVDSTHLTVTIPAGQTTGGYIKLVVSNASGAPGPGSNALNFTVLNPVPVVTEVSPSRIVPSAAAQIEVRGAGFLPSSRIEWNGTAIATTYENSSRLTATVAAGSAAGEAEVVVSTPRPGGGSSAPYIVSIGDALPGITSVAPSFVMSGTGPVQLVVRGEIGPDAIALWNGTPRPTARVNADVLVALSAEDVASAGTGSLTIANSAGAESGAYMVPIVEQSPGAGVVRTIAQRTNDIVADPVRPLIYASVPAGAPQYASSVIAIDPVTSAIVWSIPCVFPPANMAVSDDGTYLYALSQFAPSVVRVDLRTGASDLQFTLGTEYASSTNAIFDNDIVVMPGLPGSVAVAINLRWGYPVFRSVAVYDNGVRRPMSTSSWPSTGAIAAVSENTLFGLDLETTANDMSRLVVSRTGVQVERTRHGIEGYNADIDYGSGRVYVTTGDVVDVESLTVLGRLPQAGAVSVDIDGGRVFTFSNATLAVMHYASFDMIGVVGVPAVRDAHSVVRWGRDGIAVASPDSIAFVASGLVGP